MDDLDVQKTFSVEQLIPLNILVKFGYLPSQGFSDGTELKQSLKFSTELNYRWKPNWTLGAGFSFYKRNPELKGTKKEYKFRELFGIVTWFSDYKGNKRNLYAGLKGNLYLILWEASGDLDNEDQKSSSLGFEPFVGMMFPIRDHVFLDVSLSYQYRVFPVLHHQEGGQETNVSDSHVVLATGLRF